MTYRWSISYDRSPRQVPAREIHAFKDRIPLSSRIVYQEAEAILWDQAEGKSICEIGGFEVTNEILEGWKAIVEYLKRSQATIKRYKKRGLPITRNKAGHPIITKKQVDEWLLSN
jgi:hypothetical protein